MMATSASALFAASTTLIPFCSAHGRPAFVGPSHFSLSVHAFGRRRSRQHCLLASTLVESSRPRIWIEEAEDGFVDHDENLEEGEKLVKAVRAFANDEGNDKKKFLCAGALVQRPPSPFATENMTIYDAWMADAIMGGNGGPNLQVPGSSMVLDNLYLHFLNTCADNQYNTAFVVQCGKATSQYTCASYSAALSRGFRPIEDLIVLENEGESRVWYDEIVDGLVFDPALGIERFTNAAWYHRGTSQGDIALDILRHISSSGKPFLFECRENFQLPYWFERLDPRSTTALAQQVLPSSVVTDVNQQLMHIEQAGLLDNQVDSVDNYPSHHLSLTSNGQTIVEEGTEAASILSLVETYVEDLLPKVQTAMNDTSVQVSDIFLRTYGSSEDSAYDDSVRHELDAHYDCYNFATAVIALDDAASNGTQGLYTLLRGSEGENGSGHSALRRYFPLTSGDAVIHSWRVKHGVKIPPNQRRASLVVWFNREGKGDGENKDITSVLPPPPIWLAEGAREGDDVAQFVLASAMESLCFYCDTNDLSFIDVQSWSNQVLHPHDLLIHSALSGNADALGRLGTICHEREMSDDRREKVDEILEKVRPAGAYGRLDSDPLELGDGMDGDDEGVPDDNEDINWRLLARKLWFEAALRGNPLAQTALGDEALDPTFPPSADELLMAKTFYSLAAHQGYAAAKAALSNLEKLE